jgi:hypothetical protein
VKVGIHVFAKISKPLGDVTWIYLANPGRVVFAAMAVKDALSRALIPSHQHLLVIELRGERLSPPMRADSGQRGGEDRSDA